MDYARFIPPPIHQPKTKAAKGAPTMVKRMDVKNIITKYNLELVLNLKNRSPAQPKKNNAIPNGNKKAGET